MGIIRKILRRDSILENNMVQTIGSAAILASISSGIKDFVMIGNLTLLPQCKKVFGMMEQIYGVRYHIPKHSEFATAIGSALNYFKKQDL